MTFPLHSTIWDFAIALFIGALVGIEREKRQSKDAGTGIGGLRTFILVAQAGALAAWLSAQLQTPWIFVSGAVCVVAMVAVGYYVHAQAQPASYGLTTEIAAIVVYLLGGATLFGYRTLAVALAIVTSAVLAYKEPLHGMVGRLDRDDIFAALKLLIASFVVLPILPNRTVDIWGALNPYKIWLLVVLISALSLLGYVASRWLGANRGIPLTGIIGGLVSSTAVSLSFARQSRDDTGTPGIADALAAGLMLSWAVMFGRVLVVVGVVYADLLRPLLVPMVAMGVMSLAAALLFYRRSQGAAEHTAAGAVPLKNPFSLMPAVRFGLLFVAVLLVVALARRYLPPGGFYAVAALAGLTDVDAITLSMADFARGGGAATMAVIAIVIGVVANTAAKCGLVLALGRNNLKARTLIATGAILLSALVLLA